MSIYRCRNGAQSYSNGTAKSFVYPSIVVAHSPYTIYLPPPGQPWQLIASNRGYILTNEFLTFDAAGCLQCIVDAYGGSIT